jgi:hypothetical protein
MAKKCPKCGGSVERINRNQLGRTLSKAVKFYNFRCRSQACRWEGALLSASSIKKAIAYILILVLAIFIADQAVTRIVDYIDGFRQLQE